MIDKAFVLFIVVIHFGFEIKFNEKGTSFECSQVKQTKESNIQFQAELT